MTAVHTMRPILMAAAALALGLALAGCESFDPLEKISNFNPFGEAKKPLPGERKPVFPEGVPGVPQGVPPEYQKGAHTEPENALTAQEPAAATSQPETKAAAEKPKPKTSFTY
jgi:hypothetical protein